MNLTKQAYPAERPEPLAHRPFNRSPERLESARAVLTRAVTQLSQADAILRGEAAAEPPNTANILEYVDRSARGTPPAGRTRIERTRPWTRELANLRGRAVKCGLRAGGPLNPLAQVTEDTLAAGEAMLQELAASVLECERLRGEVRAEADEWEHLFAAMPMACIVADRNGGILDANHAAGLLLNLGPKRLKGRNLLVFSKDRVAFADVVERAAVQADALTTSLIFRPRERKPLPVTIRVVPPTPDSSGPWLWFLSAPASPASGTLSEEAFAANAVSAADDAEPMARCTRCGDETPGGQHASDAECLEALEREIRGLRSRVAEVQNRCSTLAGCLSFPDD